MTQTNTVNALWFKRATDEPIGLLAQYVEDSPDTGSEEPLDPGIYH